MPLATQLASSVSCVLARMIAPALSRFLASVASYGGTRSANARAPPVGGRSAMAASTTENGRVGRAFCEESGAATHSAARVGASLRIMARREGNDAGDGLLK